MAIYHFMVFFCLIAFGLSQRSPYAGRRPIGYPEVEVSTTSTTTTTTQNALGNRFGNNQTATRPTTTTTTTTQRLPIEALGDRELVNRLSQLPIDNQPFWLLNWQELEKHRSRPHTFDQKPNIFNNQFATSQNGRNNQI